MFIAALFTTMVELSDSRNNPNVYQLISGLTDYQAIKINEVVIHAATWINILNERSQLHTKKPHI